MSIAKKAIKTVSSGAKIGFFLKYWRERNKLSLGALSRASGLTPSFILRLERGIYRSVKFDAVERIAKSLKMTVEDFLRQCEILPQKSNLPSLEYFLAEKYQFSPQAIEEVKLIIEFIQERNRKAIALSRKKRQEFRARRLTPKVDSLRQEK
jgi:transcriptional regulator with XRE-family HTH domain